MEETNRLRMARARAGFANEAMAAKAIGCSRPLVIAWESDKADIRKSSFAYAAAIAYKVRPEWIHDPNEPDGFPWSPDERLLAATASESAANEADPGEDVAVVQGHIVAVLAAIPSVGRALLERLDAEPNSDYLTVLKGKLRHELASQDVGALRAAARKARGSGPRKHR